MEMIRLVALDVRLAAAWKKVVPPSIEVHTGDIFDIPVDALVSPANSFGFMDGGIDQVYTDRFGPELQAEVQRRIKADFGGELLVGQALSVPTPDADFPNLICAPTMRVPMRIDDPSAVRLATRAAVRCAMSHGFKSIAIPGMGTGTGQVKYRWAAHMMAAGIDDALRPAMFPKSIGVAAEDHFKAYPPVE